MLEISMAVRNWRLSADALRDLQERRLRAVVRHAYERVPYYQRLFRSVGLAPDDIRVLEDVQKIPITSKSDLLAAGVERRVALGTDMGSCRPVLTSGSSGQPFLTYLTPTERASRLALEARAMAVIGRRLGDRTVVLGPEGKRRKPLHQRLGIHRTELIRASLLPDVQIQRIREVEPHILWAYPSVLTAVLHEARYRLSEVAQPRVLISSSEMLEPWLREMVQDDIHPEIFNWYGCMEVGRIAFECPAHQGLHVNADHVVVETVVDGRPTAPGQTGRTVLTSLGNFTTPYLRYDLGDTCILSTERCPCGSVFPLLRHLEGRRWEMVTLPSGRLLSPHFIRFALRRLPWIQRFLIVQESRDHLRILLASSSLPDDGVLAEISDQCRQATGESVRFTAELVDSLDGQMPYLGSFISRLPDWRPTSAPAKVSGVSRSKA